MSKQAPNKFGEVILRASRVSKSYPLGASRVNVLSDVSMEAREGEFVAIEGRSGSGKSTLLHLLGALDTPDAGELRFADNVYSEMSAVQRATLRARSIGFIFQFYHLLPECSVLENVLMAAMVSNSTRSYLRGRKEIHQRAEAVLERVGLKDRLGFRPAKLSGGERQRVAIARALMNEPRLVLADEPTGNLDARTGQGVMDLLEQLCRQDGRTIVMVTHDASLSARADRVLVLRDGRF